MFRDYYEILDIDPGASNDEIKKAYRNRAREAHPDRHHDNKDSRTEEMSLINEAYGVLGDRRERTSYDIEWRRYYRQKGMERRARNSGGKGSKREVDDLTRPVYFDVKIPPKDVPFWKTAKFLVIVLVVLVLLLGFAIGRKFRKARFVDPGIGNIRQEQTTHPQNNNRPQQNVFGTIPQDLEAARDAMSHDDFDVAIALATSGIERLDALPGLNDEVERQFHTQLRAGFLNLIADAQLLQGDNDAAYETLHVLLEMDPEREETVLRISLLEIEMGNAEAAKVRLEEYLARHPDSVRIQNALKIHFPEDITQ